MTPLRTEIEARIAEIEELVNDNWFLDNPNDDVNDEVRYLLSIVKAAMGLYDVVDDNKKASEQGFQVYPLEKDILKALTAFEKAVRGK